MLITTTFPLKKLKYFIFSIELLGTPRSTFKLNLKMSHLYGLHLLIGYSSTWRISMLT